MSKFPDTDVQMFDARRETSFEFIKRVHNAVRLAALSLEFTSEDRRLLLQDMEIKLGMHIDNPRRLNAEARAWVNLV